MKHKKLFYFELQPGMTIAEDVYSDDGKLITVAGTKLTEQIISKLSYNSIIELSIIEDDEDESKDTNTEIPDISYKPVINSTSYSQRIKSSQDFKVFKEDYLENISDIKNMFNDVVNRNMPIDPQTFIDHSMQLLGESYNSIHIFDMLHNMRDFDDATHVHSLNVGLISGIIGKWLNFDKDDIDTLILCGIFHDIGKLTIPHEILTKPAKLTDKEYAIMKNHPVNGYNLIKDQNIDSRVKESCLLHHERCDGSGYPFKLTGNKIPMCAKIIAVADVYDAMTANRCYRNALCPFEVIKIFEDEGLYHYDPLVILTFLENITQTYIHNTVQLNDGRTGEIVLINKMNLTKPVIQCGNEFINLAEYPDLSISAII